MAGGGEYIGLLDEHPVGAADFDCAGFHPDPLRVAIRLAITLDPISTATMASEACTGT
jgi:hypothetical protein